MYNDTNQAILDKEQMLSSIYPTLVNPIAEALDIDNIWRSYEKEIDEMHSTTTDDSIDQTADVDFQESSTSGNLDASQDGMFFYVCFNI